MLGMRTYRHATWLWLISFVFILSPQKAFAHAVLLHADPPLNSHLQKAPDQVRFLFNERLERELYYIRLFDKSGKRMATNTTKMSEDQKEISLDLPPLKNGIYTITYHIISSDGHPVEQSSVLTIGEGEAENPNVNVPSTEGHQHGGISFYADRSLYYLSLLLLTGWTFWSAFYSFLSIRSDYLDWLAKLKHFYFFMLVGSAFIEFSSLLNGWGLAELNDLLFHSTVGVTWLISFVLAILSYVLLQRNKWVDVIWAIVLLGVEGINGHAITVQPKGLTVTLNVIHLIASALWVGGLSVIILFWKKHKDAIRAFLPFFSRVAFVSILVLTVTGLLSTWLFLPNLNYLLETVWGGLLIAKSIFVVFIILIAVILRKKMKDQNWDGFSTWMKWDAVTMLLIIGVVGVLTFQSPIPENTPILWHETTDKLHLSTQITPAAPGPNEFHVEAFLNDKKEFIKRIQFLLKNKEGRIAPIEVPLKSVGNSVGQYEYIAKGPYLPFAGDWIMEVRILDSNDDETVYNKDFTIY